MGCPWGTNELRGYRNRHNPGQIRGNPSLAGGAWALHAALKGILAMAVRHNSDNRGGVAGIGRVLAGRRPVPYPRGPRPRKVPRLLLSYDTGTCCSADRGLPRSGLSVLPRPSEAG